MTELSPRQVFMSYSRRDGDVTQRIVSLLRKQGFDVWLDNEKLIAGTPIWETEIETAIKRASAIVVILSPDSKNSEWVRREISLADQYRKRVFPVLVRGDEESSISLRLINRQYVDIRENENAKLGSLASALLGYIQELDNEQKENVKEIVASQNTSQESLNLGISKNVSHQRDNQGILWATLGWAFAGLLGGFLYSENDDLAGGAMGGLMGGLVGAFIMSLTLRSENIPSRQNNIIKAAVAWAIAGAIGWFIGWEVLSDAIGAGIGIAIFAIIGMVSTLGMDYISSNWKNIAVITLAWLIGGALGWIIARRILIDTLYMDPAMSWAIGTAIGWAIGGYVMSWQLTGKQS
jgi:TIR domain